MAAAALDIRPGPSGEFPPGPPFLRRLLSGRVFRQTALTALAENATRYGDLVHYRAFNRHIYQLNHPSLVENFLLKDAGRHHRNLVMQRAKVVLGEGLLTSEEPLHMRQRRLAQPAFLRQRVAAYGEVIGANATAVSASWTSGSLLDVHTEMLELALRIVGKCLFDLDVQSRSEVMKISSAVDAFMDILPIAILPFSHQIQRLPLPVMRRIRQGKIELDALIYAMIRERRAAPGDRGDLLSMLLAAEDSESADGKMSDTQVHDECLTIMLAGHETTANALSFALWLMARHPDIQQRVHREARTVLGSRIATAADYARLPYALQVFSEALRLYPPVWVTARTCVEHYELAGYRIPAGASVIAPQFVIHRDARFFDHPDSFNPDRFAVSDRDGGRPRNRFAFFPFGGGSRQCIGEGLAWMEGVLALATIARDWHLALPPGAPEDIAIKAAITLRPAHGVPLLVQRSAA